jgi:hypothetical protein
MLLVKDVTLEGLSPPLRSSVERSVGLHLRPDASSAKFYGRIISFRSLGGPRQSEGKQILTPETL